jgi:Ni/Fe-hydrogenase subunit HybB-like protein
MLSTDPLWYSSTYGVIFMGGQAIIAIATGIILLRFMSQRDEAVGKQATIDIFNDLGNFLLAFTSFWAYVSFSQYLILWSANLPETITWYIDRGGGGWQYMAIALIVVGFAIPFVLLLSRKNKRNIKLLMTLAFLAIFMRFVDLF